MLVLIVLIPDHCLSIYFTVSKMQKKACKNLKFNVEKF